MTRSGEKTLQPEKRRPTHQRGFSLIELLIVCVVFTILMGAAVNYLTVATQRSQSEQTKVDLTAEAREFVDEFERDLHQAGYPGCGIFNTGSNCPAQFNNSTVAVRLVSVSNTQVVFEGDVNGDGIVESVRYRIVDSAGAYPPTGTCACTMQRSEVAKVNGTAPLAQPTNFSQELQNVVNSGVPAAGTVYGNGLPITGADPIANAAFKDYPVFSAYDQYGAVVALPADITTAAGQTTLATIRSLRLTINLLGNATTGLDMKTRARPVLTLVGDVRVNNN